MLGIENCAIMYCGMFGGFIGGALTAFAYRRTQKFNMSIMEDYWRSDISHLKSHIEVLESKLSTISVAKPVINVTGHRQGKSYNHKRQFNQKG